MYYHASQVANIKELKPNISNHGISQIYFSSKRENTLVYLSNAIEKYCKESAFQYDGIWQKWASYGFYGSDILRLEEYYPNAIYETYKGVSGYIYSMKSLNDFKELKDIPNAYVTREMVEVESQEYIEDAYDEIMKMYQEGKIDIVRYEDLPDKQVEWLERIIPKEYEEAVNHPEYRFFLKEKFGGII
jgi:hypothetical protein